MKFNFPKPLPEGWLEPDAEDRAWLKTELEKEIPPGHLLHGKEVEIVAHREGTDDVLCHRY